MGAQTVGTLGAIARDAGDNVRAADLIATSAAMAAEVGGRWWESGTLGELAALSLKADEIDQAERDARASLATAADIGDRGGKILGVGLLAAIAAARGEHARNAYGKPWLREYAVAPLGGWRRHREDIRQRIQTEVGETVRQRRADAQLDEAAAVALRPPKPPTGPTP